MGQIILRYEGKEEVYERDDEEIKRIVVILEKKTPDIILSRLKKTRKYKVMDVEGEYHEGKVYD